MTLEEEAWHFARLRRRAWWAVIALALTGFVAGVTLQALAIDPVWPYYVAFGVAAAIVAVLMTRWEYREVEARTISQSWVGFLYLAQRKPRRGPKWLHRWW